MTASLMWSKTESPIPVTSTRELDRALDSLEDEARQGTPFLVKLVLDNDDTLAIGLGDDRKTVLSFVAGSERPPYYVSSGGQGVSLFVFFYYGSWSEFTPEEAIPLPAGRRAMRYFLEHGILAPFIQWAEV